MSSPSRSHAIWRGGVQVRAEVLVESIPDDGWQRIDVRAGGKAPRRDEWACGRLPYLTGDGQAQWLLIRRSVAKPGDLAYYRANGREATPVAHLARPGGPRWSV